MGIALKPGIAGTYILPWTGKDQDMPEHLNGRPESTSGTKRKPFTTAHIDESVWQQVLKIADKNEDFKARLRALGLLE